MLRIQKWVRHFAGAMVVALAADVALAQQPSREFRPGALRQLEDLPASRLRDQIERLPIQARDRAVAWLGSFHFTQLDLDSLHVDPAGGVFYADNFNLAPVPQAGEPVVAAVALPVSPFPASLRFHSRPGAPNVLFLNFSGENVSGTAWNSSVGRGTISAVAFSADNDLSTFNDAEQLAIKRIWQRVSEDYAAFNIDVTTERPATFGTRVAHALITRSTDANGQANPASGSGGVAYINVFGSASYATYRPAWIYSDNLASEESYLAEAVSHEVGHNLGLSHDGRTDGSEYYGGHGSGETSWGPLMGTGYNRNVSQWSKGEYYLANNTQDDLATIAAKLSYSTDDHGNTAAAATALTIIGGTEVISTTPENDPARTNLVNKGVLERNTDVDVFSFASGNGPVNLTVRPWVSPSGLTRGGNLDVSLDLRDVSGALLLANNSAAQTAASIQTNLSEGIYYLYVRNSGMGNPLNSTPTGYAVYGSVGQYFITGSVTPSGVVIPPGAELEITDITQPGTGSKPFTVVYSDNVAIDVSTIDANDVRVTGPNGYSRLAQLVSVDSSIDGTPRLATYSIEPPGGASWMPADNGIYEVSLQPDQVSDIEGAFVPASVIAQFRVNVPRAIYFANMDTDQGWALEGLWQYGKPLYTSGGPTAGFTGTNIIGYNLSGNYDNRLNAVYATTPAINCSGSSTLTLRFRRWLRLRNQDTANIQVSTNGSAWTDVWSTTKAVADGSWVEVQYALPSWTAGSPTLRLRWGLASGPAQNDIGWNIDDVQILGGSVDAMPPIPSLSAANITSGGSPAHSFTVTYVDDSGVSIASLGSGDLLVTGPNGFSNLVEFVGVDTTSDGTPRTATYSVAAPGATWGVSDNGSYQITLQDGEVTDTLNNAIDEAVLGSFTVAIATNQQALVVAPLVLSVPEGSNSVFTVRLAAQPSANVVMTTVRVSGDPDLVIQSGGTNVFTPENWSAPIPVIVTARRDPDQLSGAATFECRSDGLAPVTLIATEEDNTPDSILVVTANNPAWGRVTPMGGVYPVGTLVQLTASASDYFRFVRWTGSYVATNNPLAVLMDTNVTIQASFAEIVAANHATPHWWLASNGHTNNFDAAELLPGANQLPFWQSYIAGLNPNDPTSQLRLWIEHGNDGQVPVLRWNTVADRYYTVLRSTNLMSGFVPLDGASNLPPSVQSFTNVPAGKDSPWLYRLQVRRP